MKISYEDHQDRAAIVEVYPAVAKNRIGLAFRLEHVKTWPVMKELEYCWRHKICHYCKLQFNTLDNLDQHQYKAKKHKVWHCCGQTYPAEADLRNHLKMPMHEKYQKFLQEYNNPRFDGRDEYPLSHHTNYSLKYDRSLMKFYESKEKEGIYEDPSWNSTVYHSPFKRSEKIEITHNNYSYNEFKSADKSRGHEIRIDVKKLRYSETNVRHQYGNPKDIKTDIVRKVPTFQALRNTKNQTYKSSRPLITTPMNFSQNNVQCKSSSEQLQQVAQIAKSSQPFRSNITNADKILTNIKSGRYSFLIAVLQLLYYSPIRGFIFSLILEYLLKNKTELFGEIRDNSLYHPLLRFFDNKTNLISSIQNFKSAIKMKPRFSKFFGNLYGVCRWNL